MKNIILAALLFSPAALYAQYSVKTSTGGVGALAKLSRATMTLVGVEYVYTSTKTADIASPAITMHGPNRRLTVRDGSAVSTVTANGFYGNFYGPLVGTADNLGNHVTTSTVMMMVTPFYKTYNGSAGDYIGVQRYNDGTIYGQQFYNTIAYDAVVPLKLGGYGPALYGKGTLLGGPALGINNNAPAHMLDVNGGCHFTSSMTVDAGYYGSGSSLTGVVHSPIESVSQTFTSSVTVNGAVDVPFGGVTLKLGADNTATTRTESTAKYARMGSAHYTNTEEPSAIAVSESSNGNNILSIGGGSGFLNTATILDFYTAANQTTLTGTKRMSIASDGAVTIPGSSFSVGGSTLAVVQGNVNIGGSASNADIFTIKPPVGSTKGLTIRESDDGFPAVSLFSGSASGFAELYVAGATKIRLVAAGNPSYINTGNNFGVGTPAPDQMLTVAGNISTTGQVISSGTGSNYFAGKVGVGTASPSTMLQLGESFAISHPAGAIYPGMSITSWANSAAAQGIIDFNKSRNDTPGTHTLIQADNIIGAISFRGSNGTDFVNGAFIQGIAEATPGTGNDMPVAVRIMTSADGAANPTERMRITSAGKVGIADPSPDYALDVVGQIGWGNDTYPGVLSYTSNPPGVTVGATAVSQSLMLGVSGNTSALTIEGTTGDIGVGTTTPSNTLTVKPDSAGYGISVLESDAGNDAIQLTATASAGSIALKQTGATKILLDGATSANSYFNTGGNVGVGTPIPSAKLEVSSGAIVNNGTGAGITTTGDVYATAYHGSGAYLTGLAGGGDAVLAATQTWTGGNTFQSSTTFNGSILGDTRFTTETSTTTFSGYVDIGLETVSATGVAGSIVVDCPAGKYVLGGGCSADGSTSTKVSMPQGSTGWGCAFTAVTNAGVYAICARVR